MKKPKMECDGGDQTCLKWTAMSTGCKTTHGCLEQEMGKVKENEVKERRCG